MTELLSISTAAKALGHSQSWLRRKIRARQIPAYRPFGGHPMVKAEDVERLIEESLVTPSEPRQPRETRSRTVKRIRLIAAAEIGS